MHTDFVRECEAEIASLKERIAQLEQRLAAFEAQPAPQPEEEVDFTGVEIGLSDLTPEAPEVVPEAPAQTGAESSTSTSLRDPVRANVPAEDSAPVSEPVPEPEAKPVPELPQDTYSWQLARPGASVKNIRSGISLLDRALFIGTLFKEDFALYDATIADLNAMSSLAEAHAYIVSHFPDWNLNSDAVFNFMMAVRKKLG